MQFTVKEGASSLLGHRDQYAGVGPVSGFDFLCLWLLAAGCSPEAIYPEPEAKLNLVLFKDPKPAILR